MKPTLLLLTLASCVHAGQPIIARITPEALAEIQKDSPMASLEAPNAAGVLPELPTKPSIIKQSLILHDGKNWTLVPRGAVLYVPDAMKKRVDAKPVGKLLPWVAFLSANVSWINTKEISFDQAAGNEAVPMENSTAWTKQDKVVVAVHQRGPISVNVAAAGTQANNQK